MEERVWAGHGGCLGGEMCREVLVIKCEGKGLIGRMDWRHVVRERKVRSAANAVLNIWVPQNTGS